MATTSGNHLLEIIPNRINVQEEARLYDELCEDDDSDGGTPTDSRRNRSSSPDVAPSLFSRESIWLQDHSGESAAFAQDVEITGWTSVGDKKGGAYIVYDCSIKTKEGTVIHAHKRYSAFEELETALRLSLPRNLQSSVPDLPPKAPLSKYRPVFLERRRQLLQHWLSSVLLHPEIGACKAVRLWVVD